ncbi:hypothetical protein AMATHDRAFT_45046 [Amanita thiersii Skay4041]|uniref:DNA-directed RNA polymerase III subunit RPC9 n=1 Tax=Amanita thiersii Skay4041 TaxID=703135 RepID=A0A2A9P0M1_9AGAR|nr:hypothetical protein AMATHDRAFT_45046 [Amanita thiersii Skay4041]
MATQCLCSSLFGFCLCNSLLIKGSKYKHPEVGDFWAQPFSRTCPSTPFGFVLLVYLDHRLPLNKRYPVFPSKYMEVLNKRAALLSNYEVLTLLRELDSEHVAKSKTAHRIKKEEADVTTSSGVNQAPTNIHGTLLDTTENLRTIEVEAIQYLSSDYLPTNQQTPEGITQLVDKLAPYGLTKAEKLQVVNLAPTLPVEIYVIVEELEDRIGDQMDTVISLVQSSLTPAVTTTLNGQPRHTTIIEPIIDPEIEQHDWDAFCEEDAIGDDEQFDDTGEGAGIQGDLEMDED